MRPTTQNRGNDKVEIDYIEKKHKKVNGARPGFVIYHTNYSLVIDSRHLGTDSAGIIIWKGDLAMRYKALKAAFPYTLPIFTGFWFLGMAYGIYANASGFSFLYPMFMSLLIYGGSLEFVTVEMLLSPFAPVQVLIMALLIQARHLFYGLSMLDKFKGLGWKKYYLIFGMCDETFSINCSVDIPEGVDSGWFMFFVTLLNQLYWAGSATLGALAGSLLHINTEGISFVMTAMFVVIFLEQWMKETNHTASILGLLISVICLICFGADAFLIPTMILIVVLLALLKPRLDKKEQEDSP